MSSKTGWYGVDLDGTLAHYDGWKGATHIGDPVPRMLERVKKWLDEGKDVRIFTARVYAPDVILPEDVQRAVDAAHARTAIEKWCLLHIGRVLPITCVKDYSMITLYDDRAKQVVPNTGFCVDGTDVLSKDDGGFMAVRAAILGRGFYRHEVDLLKTILDNACFEH